MNRKRSPSSFIGQLLRLLSLAFAFHFPRTTKLLVGSTEWPACNTTILPQLKGIYNIQLLTVQASADAAMSIAKQSEPEPPWEFVNII
jgi:hypothetical protein